MVVTGCCWTIDDWEYGNRTFDAMCIFNCPPSTQGDLEWISPKVVIRVNHDGLANFAGSGFAVTIGLLHQGGNHEARAAC